jgi:hypothetical protein
MLFNLSRQRHFTNTGKGNEIYCYSDLGPCYGNGELCACEPFNGDGKCYSYANFANYKIKEEGGKNMLTNKEGKNFTITELEVWSIKEVVINFMILIDIGRMKTLRETQRKTEREKQRLKREKTQRGHRDIDRASTYNRTNYLN